MGIDRKEIVGMFQQDKISIAAKIDYFRGKFVGDKLRENLEEKFRDAK